MFRAEDWRQYRDVNQKFADAVCDEVDSDDPDHPGAGLSFRAGARDDSQAAARSDGHHVLAHSLAKCGAHGDLPVAQ